MRTKQHFIITAASGAPRQTERSGSIGCTGVVAGDHRISGCLARTTSTAMQTWETSHAVSKKDDKTAGPTEARKSERSGSTGCLACILIPFPRLPPLPLGGSPLIACRCIGFPATWNGMERELRACAGPVVEREGGCACCVFCRSSTRGQQSVQPRRGPSTQMRIIDRRARMRCDGVVWAVARLSPALPDVALSAS